MKRRNLLTLVSLLILWGTSIATAQDQAVLAGSLQTSLGCPSDWAPDCAQSALTRADNDAIWRATYSLPAGSYEYKLAINGGWDENYGAGAVPGGDNITLQLGEEAAVRFYYDHQTHWITDSRNSVIATVAGDFQAAMGCGTDWDPACLRSWLQDADGDGIYSFSTETLPAGTYACKVAIDESWTENYGVGGQRDGDNYSFTVNAGAVVTFRRRSRRAGFPC